MAIYTVRVFPKADAPQVSFRCGEPGQVWYTAGKALDWAIVAFRNACLDSTKEHAQGAASPIHKIVVLSDDHTEVFSLVNELAD